MGCENEVYTCGICSKERERVMLVPFATFSLLHCMGLGFSLIGFYLVHWPLVSGWHLVDFTHQRLPIAWYE